MFFIGKTKRGDTGRVIGRSRKIRMISTGAFCLLALYALLAVFPIVRHKDEAEATTVPATTTLSIISSKDTASVDITPTSGTGTFATSAAADQAEFSVTTDNLTGYSVTLLGSDTSGQLVNAVTGDTLDTITADTTENDFRTGAASTYANKWGYRLNVNGTTTTNFMAAPTTSTAKTIYSTNAPNVTTDNYTLALGARVDYEKPAGTYTNTFVLTAVGNPISYQIDYYDSFDGTATLLEQDAQSNITASEFIISATEPVRLGYTFEGWCYGTVDHTVNPSSCTGTVYQTGDTFTFTSLPSSGIAAANLYAMWDSMEGYMQFFSIDTCKELASNADYTLTDARDGEEYTVRFIDNNCWMTQNLRFTGDYTNKTMTLDPATSDVLAATTINYNYLTTGNDSEHAKIQDDGNAANGVYYNYPAASAMTITTTDNFVVEATQSVCPAGWRLPGFSDINGVLTHRTEFNPQLSGEYWQGSLINSGYGFYWTSTSGGNSGGGNLRYYLRDYSSTLTTNKSGNRAEGFSIRCVKRDKYLQDFTEADADAMAVNEQRYLIDKRDNQPYTIAKLADGNIWMVDNLNLGGTDLAVSELNSSNTNLAGSAATISASTFLNTWKKNNSSGTLVSAEYIPITVGNSAVDYVVDNTANTKFGTLYNYCAASAGTYCMANADNTNFDTNAMSDLCPAGWRMPTGGTGSDSEYKKLYQATSSLTTQTPVKNGGPAISQSGNFYDSGTVRFQNSNGDYWASTRYGTNSMVYLITRPGQGWYSMDYNTPRSYGVAIRCIKNNSMQTFTSTEANNMATGETKVLTDSRDNNSYIVTKLADDNVWMTQNLRFTGTALTPFDSNVDSPVTMTYGDLSSGDSTTEARIKNSGTAGKGVWYNYAAASAMQITTNNADEAVNSVCPKGWRLPTHSEYDNITSLSSTFKPVAGGNYSNGSLIDTNSGYWWESTAYDASQRYNFYYNGSALNNTYYYYRYLGDYVRCVKDDDTLVMQNISMDALDALVPNVGDTYVLKDSRDGERYTVGRLADGNVWLLDNLRLNITDPEVQANLSSSTTNASDTTLNYFMNGGGTGQYAASGAISSSNWYSPPIRNTPAYNSAYRTSVDTKYGAGSNKNGNYYNYCAATAGSYCYNDDGNYGEAEEDICPSGWKLPAGDETVGSYYYAYTNGYASNTSNFQTAIGAVLSGSYSGAAYNRNERFYAWSSSPVGTGGYVNVLHISGGATYPHNTHPRYQGFAVRCIKKDSRTISDISTMQEVSPQIVAKMSDGDTATLEDSRDGQEYTVAKFNGKLWMTRNLAIGCDGSGSTYGDNIVSKTLNPTDSDVASSWSTPTTALSTGADYTDPRMACASNTGWGAWYNYAALTAGTITGSSNSAEAEHSICPRGWKIPTNAEQESISAYSTPFQGDNGGYWRNGTWNASNVFANYWSSTAANTTNRYNMSYQSGSLRYNNHDSRTDAFHIRCIAR